MAQTERRRETTDDIDALLVALPTEIVDAIHALPDGESLIEVVLDLGRRPEARYPDSELMPEVQAKMREARSAGNLPHSSKKP